jgi:hypothetical protein
VSRLIAELFGPPSFGGEGESCDCTICVTAEQHNGGTFTIQQAVNQLLKTGGTVCLGPGIFQPAGKTGADERRVCGAYTWAGRGDGHHSATSRCGVHHQPGAMVHARLPDDPHDREYDAWDRPFGLNNSIGTTIERLIVSPPGEGDGPLAGILLEAGFSASDEDPRQLFPRTIGRDFRREVERRRRASPREFLLRAPTCLQCSDTGIQLRRIELLHERTPSSPATLSSAPAWPAYL